MINWDGLEDPYDFQGFKNSTKEQGVYYAGF